MDTPTIRIAPLTAKAFGSFGEVIQTEDAPSYKINDGTADRYHDLARIEFDTNEGGRPMVSIVTCHRQLRLPFKVQRLERHPLSSQSFIPLFGEKMIAVVAPIGETLSFKDVKAFYSNGRQGVNYARGVWHLPLITYTAGQSFLVIDQGGLEGNCEERNLDYPVLLVE